MRNGNWTDIYTDFISAAAERVCQNWVEIPCGKCLGCRLEYSRQWANRCLLENEYHESSYFVTLTYDQEHVPETWYPDPSTGEALRALTLRKRDFQLFMKRLRKHTGQEIRYFAAGEYGTKTFRPHYHAIIFGLKLDDLTIVKKSPLGYPYYTSQTILRAWSVQQQGGSYAPLGQIIVAPVTWETCAYTARYTAKKNGTQGSEYFASMNLEPPFVLMSRRPGIGNQWYVEHADLFDHAFINISTETGGKKFRPPKYFYNLLEKDNPKFAECLKDIRKANMDKYHKDKLLNTDLDYLDLLEVEERALQNRTKSLERRL
ncbi:VP4 [Gokushovirus MK-2017]|nr:VP4 [Gokushovirus MK-2017]